MLLKSLSSHGWELNIYLYVMSNTLYKDHGVFFFSFFFFLFLSCIIKATNPCQSNRCPEDSSCYQNGTHFTCVSHAQEDSNRKNGEIFSSTVIFNVTFPGVGQPLCCDTGIVCCPLILCIATFTQVLQSPRRCTKLSKT